MTGWRKALGYVVAMLVLLAGWAFLSYVVDSPALPGPYEAFQQLWLQRADLIPNLLISGFRVFASVLLGLVLGAPLGLMLGRSPAADAVFAPLVFLSYPIPKAVFFPVLLVLLGIGNLSIIALITLIVFFQILVTARDASRAISPGFTLSARSLGAGRAQVFRHVIVPAAMPEIFTALRIASGTAIAVLLFAESMAGSTGLGYYIIDAWGSVQYAEMFAAILAMSLLGIVLYESIGFVERRVCRWKQAGEQG